MRRGCSEEADALTRDLIELAVVVGPLWKREDLYEFAIHIEVVVDGDFVPRVESNTRACGVMIAEGRVGPRGRAHERLRHRLAA